MPASSMVFPFLSFLSCIPARPTNETSIVSGTFAGVSGPIIDPLLRPALVEAVATIMLAQKV